MFDNIILFTHLVEIGNFTKTAEMVRLSQSTLSKRIAELESSFNKRLFLRDTRNLELTPEGVLVYQKYKHLRKSIQETMADIYGKGIRVSGNINICLPIILALSLITPFLGIYAKRYPEVFLNINYLSSLPDRNIWPFDIALSAYDDTPLAEGFHTRMVRQEFAGLYCTPAYVSKYGMPFTIEELDSHNFIGLIDVQTSKVDNFIRFINKYTQQEYLFDNRRVKLKMNIGAHMRELGLTGDYIFGAWHYSCEQDVRDGNLIPVLPEYSVSSVKFYLTHRYHLKNQEDTFLDFLFECLNRELRLENFLVDMPIGE